MTDTTTLSLVRYSPSGENQELTNQLVECYREVFSTKPWGEWLKCSCCGNSWGKESADTLVSQSYLCCDKPVDDFWPRDKVLSDLQSEIGSNASCWLALDQDKVVGFCWGYPIELGKLEKKAEIELPNRNPQTPVYVAYQDEIGVLKEYRGRKIARLLLDAYVKDISKQQPDAYVARTKFAPEPSVLYSWYTQKLGYDVFAKYPQADGRVMLSKRATPVLICG